jgi:hypothetical protein
MNTSDLSDAGSRRRLIAVITALVAVLVLTGIGIYGLINGPTTSSSTGDVGEEVHPGPVPATTGSGVLVAPQLPVLGASADPETFVRNVAETLFLWDTATGFMPLDYTSVILAVGDPSGAEQAGLATDIAAYLPTRVAWIELRKYSTSQHLVIDEVFVPAAWAVAVEQDKAGQLAPGTIAYTIEGTRHRTGIWNAKPVTSKHPVTFTVFVICEPSYDTCRLLRLSQLDNPLR